MPAALLPEDESDRVAVLHSLQLFDTPDDASFARITALAKLQSGAEFTAISLIDADRQWFKSSIGLGDVQETPREIAFCAHTILQGETLWVEDASTDARFSDNAAVTGEPGIRFYAGAPVVVRGQNIGALCVFDPRPRPYEPVLAETLETLAAVVAERCQLHRDQERLAAAVNEARQLNRALRSSEARHASLFECSNEGLAIVEAGENGGLVFAAINPAMLQATGLSATDVIGSSAVQVFGPDAGAVLEAKYMATINSGLGSTWVENYALPDGNKHFHVGLAPLPDDTGRTTRVLISGRDITEFVRSQEALRESEERYLGIFEGAANPLFVVRVDGPDFVYESGNRAFKELWGGVDVSGRTPEGLLPPGVARRVKGIYNECASTGRAMDVEHAVPTVKGLRQMCTHLSPVRDADGNIVRLLGSSRDITEQRAVAEALRTTQETFEVFFENSADALAVLTRSDNGDFIYDRLNKSAEMLVGRSEAELKGRGPEVVFPGDAAELALQRYRKCVDENVVLDFEGELVVGGVKKTIHALLAPLPSSGGRPRGLLASTRDVTQRRAEEARSREAQKLQAIGQLAGGIAHDFNNLLHIIDGFTQIALRHSSGSKRAQDSLDMVCTATERAKNLVQQLLVFSRRQISHKRAFLAASVVAETEALLRPLLGARYDLKVDVDQDAASLHVETDSSELGQALMNLAINARDAMPGGGRIEIALSAVDLDAHACLSIPGLNPGRHLRLAVRDRGHGMDPATLNRIFDPFFTTKEQGRGTGLGLAMVYGFAQQSQGAVQVETAVGEGSTFLMFLPMVPPPETLHVQDLGDAPRGNGETVLLVEDDEQVLLLTRALVQDLGYRVLAAMDGVEALELEAEHEGPIELLLTDVIMPAMGGFELAQIMGGGRPELGIVYMSGYPQRGQVETVTPPADAVFVQKPFRTPELAQALQQALSTRAAFERGEAA